MITPTFTKTGNKATVAAKLNKAIFGVEVGNNELLKQAYDSYLTNGRINLAKAKSRGEVRGGGRKPWRQKGTGRARFGSTRNPIWRGGGVAFGPTGIENYTRKINVKAKRQALRQSLSLAAKESHIKIIETFECKDGRVKPTIDFLNKVGAKGNILLVVSVKDNLVERATRNIPSIKVVQAKYLNVYDLINADTIIVSQKSLAVINDWLGEDKPASRGKTDE